MAESDSHHSPHAAPSLVLGDVTVYALRSGSLRVAKSHAQDEPSLPLSLRMVRILLDPRWTDPVPAWCWLIRHPEGDWLVDSGQAPVFPSPAMRRLDPLGAAINRHLVRQVKGPTDGIKAQLEALGIDAAAPRQGVLTHLHIDHVDGVPDLPQTHWHVHEKELRHPFGAATRHLGPAFRPKAVSLQQAPFKAFPQAAPLTQRGDLWLIPTPGHTPGHASVLLRSLGLDCLFAGDPTFTQAQLLAGKWPGITYSRKLAAQSIRRMRRHARLFPTLYLPSHDPGSAERLVAKAAIPIVADQ